jgi:hypothetical protein
MMAKSIKMSNNLYKQQMTCANHTTFLMSFYYLAPKWNHIKVKPTKSIGHFILIVL